MCQNVRKAHRTSSSGPAARPLTLAYGRSGISSWTTPHRHGVSPSVCRPSRVCAHSTPALAVADLAHCGSLRASPEVAHPVPAAAAPRRSRTDIGAPSDATAASRTLRRAGSIEGLRAALSAMDECNRTPVPLNWPPTHSCSQPRLAIGLRPSPTASRATSSSPTAAPRRRSLGQRAEARRALQLGCGDGGEAARRGVSGAATALVASHQPPPFLPSPTPPHHDAPRPHPLPRPLTCVGFSPSSSSSTPQIAQLRSPCARSRSSSQPTPSPSAPPAQPRPHPLCPTTGAGGAREARDEWGARRGAAACGVCGDVVVAGGG